LPFVEEWRALEEQSFRATMLERCPDLVRKEFAPRMLRRVVIGLGSLREKLLALDAGLDDRVLELLKLDMLRELGVLPGPDLSCHLAEPPGEELVFAVGVPGTPERRASVRRSALDRLNTLAPAMAERWPELFSGTVVDLRILGMTPGARPAPAGEA